MTDTDQEIKKVLLWFLTLAKRAVQFGMLVAVLFVVFLVGLGVYNKVDVIHAAFDPNYCQMADGSYAENFFCKTQ